MTLLHKSQRRKEAISQKCLHLPPLNLFAHLHWPYAHCIISLQQRCVSFLQKQRPIPPLLLQTSWASAFSGNLFHLFSSLFLFNPSFPTKFFPYTFQSLIVPVFKTKYNNNKPSVFPTSHSNSCFNYFLSFTIALQKSIVYLHVSSTSSSPIYSSTQFNLTLGPITSKLFSLRSPLISLML